MWESPSFTWLDERFSGLPRLAPKPHLSQPRAGPRSPFGAKNKAKANDQSDQPQSSSSSSSSSSSKNNNLRALVSLLHDASSFLFLPFPLSTGRALKLALARSLRSAPLHSRLVFACFTHVLSSGYKYAAKLLVVSPVWLVLSSLRLLLLLLSPWFVCRWPTPLFHHQSTPHLVFFSLSLRLQKVCTATTPHNNKTTTSRPLPAFPYSLPPS
jgi:hypothetical protein